MDDHEIRIDAAPQSEPESLASAREHPLGWLTRQVLRVPRLVLLVSLLLAAGSMLLAWGGLGFHTSRLDLLNPRSEYNQRWLAYLDEFGRADDAVIVVQGTDRACVVAAIDGIAATVRSHSGLFPSVLSRVDASIFRSKGLHYVSTQDLQAILDSIRQLAPVLHGQWEALDPTIVLRQYRMARAALDRLPPQHPDRARGALLDARINRLCDGLVGALDGPRAARSSAPTALDGILPRPLHVDGPMRKLFVGNRDGHFILARAADVPTAKRTHVPDRPAADPAIQRSTLDGNILGVIMVRIPVAPEGQFVPSSGAIKQLHAILRAEQPRYPHVQIGLTGLPVLENDEMRTSQADMAAASVVSLFGVACLFSAGFGGLRLPLLTVAALLIAMAWSLGFITLSVGHLNILSISFGAILIGLGIDFGIHYVTQYAQQRSHGHACPEALERTASRIGIGIVTGGVTTALAFLSAALTDFTGVAELGIIAGGGIVLCILAAIIVLPVLIQQTQQRDARWYPPHPLPFHMLCVLPQRLPRLFLVLSVSVTVIMAAGIGRLTFDHNLLHLQAEGTESVVWEHRLVESSQQSVWFALSIADTQEELLRKKRQLERLATVQRVEEIDSLLPLPDPRKARMIAQIARQLATVPTPPLVPVTRGADALRTEVRQTLVVLGKSPGANSATAARLGRLAGLLQNRPIAETMARIQAFHAHSIQATCAGLLQLRAMANPIAPTLLDFPPALVTRFIGRHGRHLMRIYANGNIWNRAALAAFVHDIESIDPRVTGHPVQTYYASRQMETSYIHAAIYALIAVAIVLMLDLQSVRMTLTAMVPMTAGLVQMLGLLGWLGIPLNPANMIVLPLILGIGIDDGVHMVHDFLRTGRPFRVSRATAAAVVLTSATTMVGFGSMMLARHQGLRSLGQVLTLGVFCCLVTTLAALPAWLNRVPWTVRPAPDAEISPGSVRVPRAEPSRRSSHTTV